MLRSLLSDPQWEEQFPACSIRHFANHLADQQVGALYRDFLCSEPLQHTSGVCLQLRL